MALLATLTESGSSLDRARRGLGAVHTVVHAPSAESLIRLVRDRPVTGVVLDLSVAEEELHTLLGALRQGYPRLTVIAVSGPRPSPRLLLEVGRRSSIRFLMKSELQGLERNLMTEVGAGLRRGVVGRIMGPLTRMVPRWHAGVVLRAVDDLHRGWSADEFADALGVSRPFLSERLRSVGLPSVGKLLAWVRIFHAAWWLGEPARTGESIARQLEYSSAPAFRRAVRNALGVTPSQVVSAGGIDLAWVRFMADCGSPSSSPSAPQPLPDFETQPSALY